MYRYFKFNLNISDVYGRFQVLYTWNLRTNTCKKHRKNLNKNEYRHKTEYGHKKWLFLPQGKTIRKHAIYDSYIAIKLFTSERSE